MGMKSTIAEKGSGESAGERLHKRQCRPSMPGSNEGDQEPPKRKEEMTDPLWGKVVLKGSTRGGGGADLLYSLN